MQIYKSLPKTNCKECGLPTCMAFAMQVAAKQRALTDCPHVSEEGKSALSEASAPPMKLVKIGAGDKVYEIGQETVMFRHEEKFHRATGVAVKIGGGLSDGDAAAQIEKINKSSFERVGATLKVQFCALEIDSASDPAARAKLGAEKSAVPLILVGSDAGKMKAALDAVKDQNPLIYRADASNIEEFAAMAAEAKAPLAVLGKDLEDLSTLSEKAQAKGVTDLVLAFTTENPADTIRSLTIARRAALKKRYKPFGFPSMVEISEKSAEIETMMGAVFSAKYGGIVLVEGDEPWELLPIFTTIQDVYVDPQVPNTVEAGLHEIGNVNENSPVLFTTNFSLTYFSVEGEVERSKVPTYICVVDTEGLGVLNAYAGDKISAEKVIKTIQSQGVAEKVKHRKLIIPGLLPIFRAEIEENSEWKEVIIGPEAASKIPAFLSSNWK
jgi:acetyl-CoA decarbonylase/synthase, CODH/ACS complex subunit gamma